MTAMKRTLIPMLLTAIFLFPVAGYCDYDIHLHNGGRVLTPQYWEEHGKIHFYIPGGIMGIDKNNIAKINQTADVLRREAFLTPPAPPAVTATVAPTPAAPMPEKRPPLAEKETSTDDANKDPAILGEFKALEKRFDSRKAMTVTELTNLKDDLTALRDKIVTGRMKYSFLEEVNKLADMRFFTNDLLIIKSKRP